MIDEFIGLMRVSTPAQAEDEKGGFPRQREDIEDCIEHHKVKLYPHVGPLALVASGKDCVFHPDYQKALKLVGQGKVAGFACSDLTRLCRNDDSESLYALFGPLEKAKATILYQDQKLDLGQLKDVRTLRRAIESATDERLNKAYQTSRGRARKRKQDSACADPRPFYIDHVRKNAKVNEGTFRYNEYMPMMRDAALRVAAGEPYASVYRDVFMDPATGQPKLNPKNINVKTGLPKPFFSCVDGFRSGLIAPRNDAPGTINGSGEWLIGRKPKMRGMVLNEAGEKERKILADEYQKGRNAPGLDEEPALSVEVFNRIQDIFSRHADEYLTRDSRTSDFLGHGLLRCPSCGKRMYHKGWVQRRQAHYYCSTQVNGKANSECKEPWANRDMLDDAIALEVVLWMTDDKLRKAAIKNLRDEAKIAERKAGISRMTTERETLEAEKKRLIVSIQKGTLTDDECADNMKQIRQRTAQLNIEIGNLESQLSEDTSKAEIEAIDRQLRYDFAHFAEKTKEDQKAVLKDYVTAIRYTRHPITDAFAVSFDFRVEFPRPEFETGNYPTTDGGLRLEPVNANNDTPIRIVKGGAMGEDIESLEDTVKRIERKKRTRFQTISGFVRWG